LLLLIGPGDVNHQKTFKPGPHFFTLTKGVQAHDKVEADVEVSSVIHDVLIDLDGFAKALLLHEGKGNVTLDLELHLFVLVGDGVKRHVVHLDSLIVLFLLKKDVSHVHSKAGGLGILFIFEYDGVRVECFLVQTVRVVHISQVVEHVESQINVYLVERASRLAKLADLFFLRGSFFGFLERIIDIFL